MSAVDERGELEARVRRLEREGRAWRLAALAAAALALAASFRGPGQEDPAPPGRLAVRELALVDDASAARAVLALDEGGPALRFLGEDGNERLALGLPAGAPLVRLSDPDGTARTVWTVDAERAAMLTFSGRGADGAPSGAWLGVNERDRPLFELQAKNREQRIFMGISDETPSLVVFHEGDTLLRVPRD